MTEPRFVTAATGNHRYACSTCGKTWETMSFARDCCSDVDDQPNERQVGGNHYTKLPIQPFEYSMANGLDPMQHTAIKYVTRFRDKGGVVDLRKAIHTIEMLIEFEEAKG